jgi:hypothetical protein
MALAMCFTLNDLAMEPREVLPAPLCISPEKRFTPGACPAKLRALIDFGNYGSEGEDD